MRITKIFILSTALTTILNFSVVIAQDANNQKSKIEISADSRIETLAERFNKTYEIRGYRIQIITASKKEAAKKAKSHFASKNQWLTAHEIYQQPFFIIKVGDFLTKLEAEKFHREIKEDFPGSFIVPDVIDPYKQYSADSEH